MGGGVEGVPPKISTNVNDQLPVPKMVLALATESAVPGLRCHSAFVHEFMPAPLWLYVLWLPKSQVSHPVNYMAK